MLNNKLIIANSKFAINIGSHSNGSISISPTGKQLPGKIITITLTPNTHYKFSSVSVTKASGGTVNLTTVTSGSKYTFKMPAANVTINASFSALPTYSVSINASGGSVRASKTSGIYAGEKITLTCTPNNYYVLSSISSPQVSLSGSGNTRTFTMPSKNVTINATFIAKYTHILGVGFRGNPTYKGYMQNIIGSLSPTTWNNTTVERIYYDEEDNVSIVVFSSEPSGYTSGKKLRVTILENNSTIDLTSTRLSTYWEKRFIQFNFSNYESVHIIMSWV